MIPDGAGFGHLIQALGWTLLHFVWQGLVVGALFWLLMRLTTGSSANVRYLLGLACFVLLALSPMVTFWIVFPLAPAAAQAVVVVSPAAGAHLVEGGATWWSAVRDGLQQLLPWAVLGWAAGVALSSVRLANEWRRVRVLATRETTPLPVDWEARVSRLGAAFGLGNAVRVLQSAIVRTPMVIGWLKPVVLVPPSALTGLSPYQLELILAHEFAHIRRHDYLVNLFQVAVETLLFYHPVVRWISAQIREERENCCDDSVIVHSGDGLAYARALTELEQIRALAPGLGMASTGGHLTHRICRLVTMPAPQRGAVHWVLGLALAAASFSVVSMTHFSMSAVRTLDREVRAPAAATAEPVARKAGERPVATAGSAEVQAAALPLPPTPVATTTTATATAEARAPELETAALVSKVEPVAVARTADVTPPAPVAARPVPIPENVLADTDEPENLQAAPALVQEPLPASTLVAPAQRQPVLSGGEFVKGPTPVFPRKARRLGLDGSVTVSFTVNDRGRVRDLEVIAAEPEGVFERAVTRAVSRWRFEPFLADGEPVFGRVSRTFQFDGAASKKRAHRDECTPMTGSRLCRTASAKPATRGVRIVYQVAD